MMLRLPLLTFHYARSCDPLDRIERLLLNQTRMLEAMTTALDDLKAAQAASNTAMSDAVATMDAAGTLIAGLAAKITAAGTDPDALKAITDDLTSKSAELETHSLTLNAAIQQQQTASTQAAAVVAAAPAADAAPQPDVSDLAPAAAPI